MSEENGNQNKIAVVCECGQSFSTPIPKAEFSNNVYTSAILIAHERLVKCVKCRQAFVIVALGAQINFGVQAVPPEIVQQVEGPIIRPLDIITGKIH